MIEPDLVVSRDGALVVRHENALSLSTDVASRPEFADRRRPGRVEGHSALDWFVEDFDLAELRTLAAVERMPGLRPLNTAYDGRSGILTLADVVDIARDRSTAERPIQVLAELKQSTDVGRVAALVTDELTRLGSASADGTVVLQSFQPALLREIRALTGYAGPRMVQLVSDSPVGDPLLTPAGLREVSTYAQGIGPSRDRLLPLDERGRIVVDGRAGGGGAPRRARRLLLDAAGRERLPPAGAAPRRAPGRPGRRRRPGPAAARPRRRRPDHRLPRARSAAHGTRLLAAV